MALVAHIILAVVKAALSSAYGNDTVDYDLSGYYIADESSGAYCSMQLLIEEDEWLIFQKVSQAEVDYILNFQSLEVKIMNLKEYFENTKGFGVLSTADSQGKVDSAVYSRPHVFEDGTVGSIMRDRLTHENLKKNPYAVYLFLEEGKGYRGKRLFLTKIREEHDTKLIEEICRRCYPSDLRVKEPRFLVIFQIDKELPLIGTDE